MKITEASMKKTEETGRYTNTSERESDEVMREVRAIFKEHNVDVQEEEPERKTREEIVGEILKEMKEREESEYLMNDDEFLARLRAIDRASRPTLWDRITGASRRKQYGRKLTDEERGMMYYLMLSRFYPVQ